MNKVFRSIVLSTSVVLLGAGSLHFLTATGGDPRPRGKTSAVTASSQTLTATCTGGDPRPRGKSSAVTVSSQTLTATCTGGDPRPRGKSSAADAEAFGEKISLS
jgi:hypothetical protein